MTEHFGFRPHGQNRIWTEDRLLVVHTRGPWNRELVLQGQRIVLEAIEKFGGAPWLALGLIYGDGLHTPEAYEEMVNSLKVQRQHGRSGTALVLVNVGESGFFRNVFSRLYASGGEPLQLFPDEASARLWLAEKRKELP